MKFDACWGRHLDKKIKKEIDRIFDQANRKKRNYNLRLLIPFGLVCLLLTGLIITQNSAPPLQPLNSTDSANPVRPANYEISTTPDVPSGVCSRDTPRFG